MIHLTRSNAGWMNHGTVGKRADRKSLKSKIVPPAYPPYLASIQPRSLRQRLQGLEIKVHDAIAYAPYK